MQIDKISSTYNHFWLINSLKKGFYILISGWVIIPPIPKRVQTYLNNYSSNCTIDYWNLLLDVFVSKLFDVRISNNSLVLKRHELVNHL